MKYKKLNLIKQHEEMKSILFIFVTIITMSAYSMKQNKIEQSHVVDSTLQTKDTVIHRPLNDIRFEGWDRKKWLDNEYIHTLRAYLNDYNTGKVCNPSLDPYKEQIKGKFVVYDISSYLLGGTFIRIVFLDMPNRVFSSWIYSNVDEKKGVVESYEFRSIEIEEEPIDMTKEDILQAIKEVDELKLW